MFSLHTNRRTGQEYARLSTIAVCATLAGVGCGLSQLRPPTLPDVEPVQRTVYLEQGWSDADRHRYHHLTQGAATLRIPFEWFLALEQPRLSLNEAPLLRAPDYLSRFGFLPSPKSEHNPGGLPVGFASDPDGFDPASGEKFTAIGFTCAACHTTQLEYRNIAVRVDGGPALTDLGKFRRALGLSLAYTELLPFRFGRFAERLLGPDHTEAEAQELRVQLREFIEKIRANPEFQSELLEASTEEGFGRLDALGRIGNTVFGTEIDPENVDPLLAPVSYPPIWGAPWFSWVQYNGSIRQPMVRNAGEALGLRGLADLTGPEEQRFRSTVRVENLFWIEHLLAGDEPFDGLRAPEWPSELFGKPDPVLVTRGAALYRELCQGCHLPPVQSEEFWDSRYWTEPNAVGERYLELKMIPIDRVGTDRNQAVMMRERTVDASRAGISESSFGPALAILVEAVVDRWYDDQVPRTAPAERLRMNGYRENLARAELKYKARPLDGIWATPPYLHNGSVPNLFLLLSPVAERPRSFYVGSRQFDPVDVGFAYAEKLRGGFEFRVDERCNDPGASETDGNCNGGHEFRDGPRGNGTIGRALSAEERRALIEYLKTL